MNLADALLLPQDDLALAVALKSPLFGLTEEELFTLAWDRKGSLRDALTARASESSKFSDALRRLVACERRFRTETPFAFYAWLLGGDGGRARILRRLGPRSQRCARRIPRTGAVLREEGAGLAAGLHGLAARRRHRSEARHGNLPRRGPRDDGAWRQGAGGSGGVSWPTPRRRHPTPSVFASFSCRRHNAPAPGVVVWAGRKADDPPCVAAARNAMLDETEHEYRRLLYVAMTRAADRLIIAGCMPGNRNSVREHSWYDLIEQGPCQFGSGSAEIPSRRRRGETLPAGGRRCARHRRRRRPLPQAPKHRCRNGCTPRPRRNRRRTPAAAVRPRRDEGHRRPDRRIDPAARPRHPARHAGAPAAAIPA